MRDWKADAREDVVGLGMRDAAIVLIVGRPIRGSGTGSRDLGVLSQSKCHWMC